MAESLAGDSTTPKRAKTAPSAVKARPPVTLTAAPADGDLDGEEASAHAAGARGKAAAPFVEVSLYDCDTEEEEEEVPLPPPAVSEKHPTPRKGAPLCELALHLPGPARDPMCCVV